jgi:hypothetical protein
MVRKVTGDAALAGPRFRDTLEKQGFPVFPNGDASKVCRQIRRDLECVFAHVGRR